MYGADALVGAVRLACGRPDYAEVTDDEILAQAQFVLDEFAVAYRPPSLSSTVTLTIAGGSDTVTLPEDVIHVRSGYCNGVKLREVDLDHFARLVSSTVTPSGQPLWYCQFASESAQQPVMLKVVPVPTVNTQVVWYVIKRHPILTLTPSPTPILVPPHFVGAIVEETAARVLASMQKREEAASHRTSTNVDQRILTATTRGLDRNYHRVRMRSLLRRR